MHARCVARLLSVGTVQAPALWLLVGHGGSQEEQEHCGILSWLFAIHRFFFSTGCVTDARAGVRVDSDDSGNYGDPLGASQRKA